MVFDILKNTLESNPIISAVTDETFEKALKSPVEVIFYLEANLLTLKDKIDTAHKFEKYIFIHIDLAEGLGKDKAALHYLLKLGADGIITTKTHLIKAAKDMGILAVQRFFTLDTKGIKNVQDVISAIKPDMIEIMPGIVTKIIKLFSGGEIPIIAGGLIETKAEVTAAISNGALAVSTGKEELWYM